MGFTKCNFCSESYGNSVVDTLECGHKACPGCLASIFGHYPAECCVILEMTSDRAEMVGLTILEEYIQMRREREASTDLCCSKPECGTFLSQDRIVGTLAICSSCHTFTCTECHKTNHGSEPCIADNDIEAIHGLAEKEGWEPQQDCEHVIERAGTCSRIRYVKYFSIRLI